MSNAWDPEHGMVPVTSPDKAMAAHPALRVSPIDATVTVPLTSLLRSSIVGPFGVPHGLTASDASDVGPQPASLCARTVAVNSAPSLMRPSSMSKTILVDREVSRIMNPLPESVTSYASIAERSPSGSLHSTATLLRPASARTLPGVSGTLSGLPSTALDSSDQPASLRARTVNEYVLPLLNPVIRHDVAEPHDWFPEPPPLQLAWYSMTGLPFGAPALQRRFTAPSCASPVMGESNGASGLSTTETSMVAVTSRSLLLVASRTVATTLPTPAPMPDAAVIDAVPSDEQSTLIRDVSSATQPTTVNGVSGNGLYASASRRTVSPDPALSRTVLAPTRANGRLDAVTRTVTPASTVPFA